MEVIEENKNIVRINRVHFGTVFQFTSGADVGYYILLDYKGGPLNAQEDICYASLCEGQIKTCSDQEEVRIYPDAAMYPQNLVKSDGNKS